MTDSEPAPELKLFYDGACPICAREIGWVRKQFSEDKVAFCDIAADTFDATRYGKEEADFMREIHALRDDGSWLSGMDVFRELYAKTRYSWLISWTGIWPFRPLFDFFYRVFARNRLRITGRSCADDSCGVA